MLFHLVSAEQLRTERRLVSGVRLCEAVIAEVRSRKQPLPENSVDTHLQLLAPTLEMNGESLCGGVLNDQRRIGRQF
jgi:hypothetical protein